MSEVKKISIEQHAGNWLKNGWDNNKIKEELLKQGVDQRNIPDLLKEISRMRNARNTATGLYFILGGAMLCLLSCILTLTTEGNTGFVLYGLTSAGIMVAFYGLFKIFG